jgi:hypothetical protein
MYCTLACALTHKLHPIKQLIATLLGVKGAAVADLLTHKIFTAPGANYTI